MAHKKTTADKSYTDRLESLSFKRWKTWLHVQAPYVWNIQRLQPGKTLDIGCGIGRYLRYLSADSVGIDHNKHSIKQVQALGLNGYVTNEFKRSPVAKKASFDSLLLSHVLEHLSRADGLALLREYGPYLRQGGQVIVCCPQENGYASDATHVTFLDSTDLQAMLQEAGYTIKRASSFPFPRFAGKFFRYNETVVVGGR